VLVSVQAQILGVELPYYNEPGVEAEAGTPRGLRQQRVNANGGFEPLRLATVQWAMLDALRHPPVGFRQVARLHFQRLSNGSLRLHFLPALSNGSYQVVRLHFLHKRRHIAGAGGVLERWQAEADDSDTPGFAKAFRVQAEALRAELRKLGPLT
jgi:hypothetical protein